MANSSNFVGELISVDYSGGDVTFSGALNGLHCNIAGALYVDCENLGTNILLQLSAGLSYPYKISKVYQSGSTASVIGLRVR
jgi:hypothetical protein